LFFLFSQPSNHTHVLPLPATFVNSQLQKSKWTFSTSFDSHESAFVVHKSRGINTLSSMHSQQQQQQHQMQQHQMQQQSQQEPLVPARLRQAKEKNNVESKADERGLVVF